MSLLIKKEQDLTKLETPRIDEKFNELTDTISDSFEKNINGEGINRKNFSKFPIITSHIKSSFGEVKDNLLKKITQLKQDEEGNSIKNFYIILHSYFKLYFKLKKTSNMNRQQYVNFLNEIDDLNFKLGQSNTHQPLAWPNLTEATPPSAAAAAPSAAAGAEAEARHLAAAAGREAAAAAAVQQQQQEAAEQRRRAAAEAAVARGSARAQEAQAHADAIEGMAVAARQQQQSDGGDDEAAARARQLGSEAERQRQQQETAAARQQLGQRRMRTEALSQGTLNKDMAAEAEAAASIPREARVAAATKRQRAPAARAQGEPTTQRQAEVDRAMGNITSQRGGRRKKHKKSKKYYKKTRAKKRKKTKKR
jgi:hypothetical protein